MTKNVSWLIVSFCLIFLSVGCSSGLQTPSPPTESSSANLQSLSENNLMILTFNSTSQDDLTCVDSNMVKLRVATKSGVSFFCHEISQLNAKAQLGLTCQAGVEVKNFSSSQDWVACENMKLCGQNPVQKNLMFQSIEGGKVWELTFQNLPWGCEFKVETATSLTATSKPDLAFSGKVGIPSCHLCPNSTKVTCLPCQALPPGSEIKYGYTIRECAPGQCKSCLVGSKTIAHGESLRTYSTSTALSCKKNCEASSSTRVCNDGVMMGEPAFNQLTCLDTLCDCEHPLSKVSYKSGAMAVFYQNAQPVCPQKCEKLELQCYNGQWQNSSGQPVQDVLFQQYSSSNCKEPLCNCARAGRTTVMNGTQAAVFKVSSVQCGESCDTTATKGIVTCKNGLLSGDISLSYDTCSPQSCGCALPGGGFLALNQYGYVYKLSSSTCDMQNSCSSSENYRYVRCDANSQQLITVNDGKPVDLNLFKYSSCLNQPCSCTYLGSRIGYGNTVTVYSKEKVGSSESCESFKGYVTCSTTGLLSGQNNPDVFKYFSCTSLGQAGQGGGAGGGLGNGEGDGEFFQRRGGGGGGGGGLCTRPEECYSLYIQGPTPTMNGCSLPWGGTMGPVRRALVTAYKKSCVIKPEKCSQHAQTRICVIPGWTGSDLYHFPSCEEKDTCP